MVAPVGTKDIEKNAINKLREARATEGPSNVDEIPTYLARPEDQTEPINVEGYFANPVSQTAPAPAPQEAAPVGMKDIAQPSKVVQTPEAQAMKGLQTAKENETLAHVSEAQTLQQQAQKTYTAAQGISNQLETNALNLQQYQKELDEQYKQNLIVQEQRRAEIQELQNAIKNINADVVETQVDPKRIFKDMNTGNKIMLAIGVGMAGVGGGTNNALTHIQNLMDKDIEAQKEASKSKSGGGKKIKYLMDIMKMKYPEAPEDAAKLYLGNKYKTLIELQGAKVKSAEAKLRAQQLANDLELKNREVLSKLSSIHKKDHMDQLKSLGDGKVDLKYEGKLRIEKINAATIFLEKVIETIAKDIVPVTKGGIDNYAALVDEYIVNKVMGRSGASFRDDELYRVGKVARGWLLSDKVDRIKHLVNLELKDLDDTMKIHTGEDYEGFPHSDVKRDYLQRIKKMRKMLRRLLQNKGGKTKSKYVPTISVENSAD